jgi:hypothetical protein
MADAPDVPARTADAAKGRRTLLLLAAIAVAPVIASYAAYYLFPREKQVNYGQLLPTGPAPAVAGKTLSGQPFSLAALRGKWLLLVLGPGACDGGCAQALHATRQARTIQNREQERVQRLWLVTDDAAPAPSLLAEHPELLVVRLDPAAAAAFPAGAHRIYLVDPLGNLVLAYPEDPDIKGMARDLTRLLTASRIG